jgi:choline transport protein
LEKQISPRTSIPVYSVAATTLIACVLALVNIGSATAFNGIVSVSIAGLFSSYLLVASLLLYRRLTGGIVSANELSTSSTYGSTTAGQGKIIWGPWRIPGILGVANNIFACTYLTFVLFFSFWPPSPHVNASNMNWSILVTCFVAGFSTLYYLVWARKTYHGPVVEVEPRYALDSDM